MKTVFVIDDEPLIIRCLQRFLVRLNYSVIVASSKEEAENVWSNTPDIDVIICDYIMNNLLGPGLIEDLDAIRTVPPVVYMTGYEDISSVNEPILYKPFTVEQLSEAINTAIKK